MIHRRYFIVAFFFTFLLLVACAENGSDMSDQEMKDAILAEETSYGEVVSDGYDDQEHEQDDDKKDDKMDEEHPPAPEGVTMETRDGVQYFSCSGEARVYGNEVHVIHYAESDDGLTWEEKDMIQAGSVPEVILFEDTYFLFASGTDCLMWESSDGLNFEPYEYGLLETDLQPVGLPSWGVDPSVIIDDDIFRLYFFEPDWGDQPPGDPAFLEGDHSFSQYVSEDGYTWEYLGEAVALEQGTDPDVVMYDDQYYMFISQGQGARAAVSDDGDTFTALEGGSVIHNLGGVPDTIVLDDMLYQYGHSGNELKILRSNDGLEWEEVGTALENAHSPSIVQLPDGTYRMYFVRNMHQDEYEELFG